ncbi:YlmC/YmxH family sporulation protein [Piscibacillus halophilus]|uniref:Sporulation protein, YlmC/YmxH family n=1 Tax=Piscibacillus halophilus TaxID=571933 RepID=A0A1H8YTF6_9BACI|nr:YlmC/YmxH family sporulation protein [Piscibacillus halophilus]SEP55311.1 sporulation protein, YlmC/YmxH family [Piscibacillus halophilus]
MLLSELQTKDIINVENGEKIGFVNDLEIDVTVGVVLALVVTTRSKLFGLFGQDEELLIRWSHIDTIGEDVILVRVPSRRQIESEI